MHIIYMFQIHKKAKNSEVSLLFHKMFHFEVSTYSPIQNLTFLNNEI